MNSRACIVPCPSGLVADGARRACTCLTLRGVAVVPMVIELSSNGEYPEHWPNVYKDSKPEAQTLCESKLQDLQQNDLKRIRGGYEAWP